MAPLKCYCLLLLSLWALILGKWFSTLVLCFILIAMCMFFPLLLCLFFYAVVDWGDHCCFVWEVSSCVLHGVFPLGLWVISFFKTAYQVSSVVHLFCCLCGSLVLFNLLSEREYWQHSVKNYHSPTICLACLWASLMYQTYFGSLV